MAQGVGGKSVGERLRGAADAALLALGMCSGPLKILCSEAAREAARQTAKAVGDAIGKDGNPTNEINAAAASVDKLINSARELEQVRGATQGFVKGDAKQIYNNLIQGAEHVRDNLYRFKDGTLVNFHYSTKTGVATIDINRAGEIYKIRVTK
jgi:hypothetical protein